MGRGRWCKRKGRSQFRPQESTRPTTIGQSQVIFSKRTPIGEGGRRVFDLTPLPLVGEAFAKGEGVASPLVLMKQGAPGQDDSSLTTFLNKKKPWATSQNLRILNSLHLCRVESHSILAGPWVSHGSMHGRVVEGGRLIICYP